MIINIGGYTWEIVFVDPDDYNLRIPSGYTIGATDLDNRTIYISNNLNDDLLYDCIAHEICHCLAYVYNFGLEIPDEECVCQIMERFSDDVLLYANDIYDFIIGQS